MKRTLTTAEVEQVRIDAIQVGRRRRRKLPGIARLARSIAARGLAHPIVVRNGNELVAGQRRLEACKSLGWKTIPTRRVEKMSDEDFRALELEENTERVDLDSYEVSKQRLAEMVAEQRAQETMAKPAQVSGTRGPAKKPGSRHSVAEQTGITPQEQRRIEDHVRIADTYPVFQGEGWRKHAVLEAGEHLEALPARECAKAVALISQDGVPPKDAIKILGNLAAMTPDYRARVLTMATSKDERDRGDALSLGAKLPPMPDPALPVLGVVAKDLQRAARVTRVAAVKPALESLLEKLIPILDRLRAADRKRWEEQGHGV